MKSLLRSVGTTLSIHCSVYVENRKSQELTFLLSVFLSLVGAANFYIGDYVLGKLIFYRSYRPSNQK